MREATDVKVKLFVFGWSKQNSPFIVIVSSARSLLFLADAESISGPNFAFVNSRVTYHFCEFNENYCVWTVKENR